MILKYETDGFLIIKKNFFFLNLIGIRITCLSRKTECNFKNKLLKRIKNKSKVLITLI